MTTQEKINLIREKCIAANPAIMELGFGCEVRQGKKVDQIWRMTPGTSFPRGYSLVHFTGAFFPDRKDAVSKSFEILGRPIRLADVLLVLKDKVGASQNVTKLVYGIGIYWRMKKDDLRDQSPECIDFLYSLLK